MLDLFVGPLLRQSCTKQQGVIIVLVRPIMKSNTAVDAKTQRKMQPLSISHSPVVIFVAALAVCLLFVVGAWLQRGNAPSHLTSLPSHENTPDGSGPSSAENQQYVEQCSCEIDDPTTFASTVGLSGTVSDCCCSFGDIEMANGETVYPLLRQIVQTPFFAHFKINLCSSCELWEDAPMCMLKDCGVCECEKPPDWAREVEWLPNETGPDPNCEHIDDQVVITVDAHIDDGWPSPPLTFLDDISPIDSVSANGVQDDGNAAVVVDLRLNPERYTGYAGPSSEKVWTAIHTDNCFQQQPKSSSEQEEDDYTCSLSPDERIYNRIISGLHSSISLHIAHSYCLEMDQNQIAECKIWGKNSSSARERVLDHKDRLENLYAIFAVLLRAVQKAGSAVTAAVPVEDPFFDDSLSEWTYSLLPQISTMAETCPLTFDETSLFLEGAGPKRGELQRRFKHLLKIMQCVGCDRCRLWGTLQTLGIGTALKILLDDSSSRAVSLSRQEAVALVHTLERFSSALKYASEFSKM